MKLRTVTAIVMIILLILPQIGSDISSSTTGDLCISEVSPADEAITICNRGLSDVDLKEYSLTDGEGTLRFVKSKVLSPGQSIIISKQSGTDWFTSRSPIILYPSVYIEKTGSFILADSGDEVLLKKETQIVDSICYGKSPGTDGWTGPPVEISSGKYLERRTCRDSDTASDWIATKPGWTNRDTGTLEKFPATVTPFTFPECNGAPILDAIESAQNTIDISIYLLSSPMLAALLCMKETQGVEVRVLLEGTPLGTDISTELSLMRALSDSGGEVRFINYSGSESSRYTYVHNKYAVIDTERTVITSENWTSGNIGDHGNRGWGVVIESREYAQYMEDIFENDFSDLWGDVSDIVSLYPDARPSYGLNYERPSIPLLESYDAYVSPVLSPDNSFISMRDFIGSAKERLYAEQMDLGKSLSSVKGETPVAWMAARSSEGVETKFILDSSQSNGSTHESYINLITSASSVEAISKNGGDNYTLIHNKGVISDSRVWIGSVNWTDTSFTYNRESAVIIDSSEVSEYFACIFLQDFGVNIFTVEDTGLDLTAEVIDADGTMLVKLSTSGPDGYTYTWELGDGTVRTGTHSSVLFKAPATGDYTATVHMMETDLSCSVGFHVPGTSSKGIDPITTGALACGIAICLWGLAVAIYRERRRSRRRRPRPSRRIRPPNRRPRKRRY